MLHIAGQARGQTLMHNHNVQYCVIRLFYMASSSPKTQRKILQLATTFSLVLFKTETTRLNQITNLNHLHMQPWLITHSFRIKETTGRVIFHLICPVFRDARAPPPPPTNCWNTMRQARDSTDYFQALICKWVNFSTGHILQIQKQGGIRNLTNLGSHTSPNNALRADRKAGVADEHINPLPNLDKCAKLNEKSYAMQDVKISQAWRSFLTLQRWRHAQQRERRASFAQRAEAALHMHVQIQIYVQTEGWYLYGSFPQVIETVQCFEISARWQEGDSSCCVYVNDVP